MTTIIKSCILARGFLLTSGPYTVTVYWYEKLDKTKFHSPVLMLFECRCNKMKHDGAFINSAAISVEIKDLYA